MLDSPDLTPEGIPESSMEVKGKTLSSCLRTVLTLAAYCQEQGKDGVCWITVIKCLLLHPKPT